MPPISARGCAGLASGEPITRTIEVANGTTTRGNPAWAAIIAMTPMATPLPAARATIRAVEGLAAASALSS
jgi:hypothetical protein